MHLLSDSLSRWPTNFHLNPANKELFDPWTKIAINYSSRSRHSPTMTTIGRKLLTYPSTSSTQRRMLMQRNWSPHHWICWTSYSLSQRTILAPSPRQLMHSTQNASRKKNSWPTATPYKIQIFWTNTKAMPDNRSKKCWRLNSWIISKTKISPVQSLMKSLYRYSITISLPIKILNSVIYLIS